MPQTRVSQLHQTAKMRILPSGAFLLGDFVTVASVVHIVELETIDMADLTYTVTMPSIWIMMEMKASIICAGLPTLSNVFRHWHDQTEVAGKDEDVILNGRLRRVGTKSYKIILEVGSHVSAWYGAV
ncbi:hypothetical protein K461DRAFT_279041 [Myriangium duriaei CBS 260.36]|uniref:Rhodopsin domain-containing protein n=1 Tax=Myriangium duriaei CBS 260.36 TaxID=1168546 RepID=A0A9P4MMJ3_9PEZI|nr:hypothetical protein K461DRAFT_279041 [Myriangium duriaei CBS 260.36]